MKVPVYEIFVTQDGSHSLRIRESKITFHSTFGAVQETQHIFINAGLKHFKSNNRDVKKLKIFEVGFGTGLNALMSAMEAPLIKTNIEYHSIDLEPLSANLFFRLNYADILKEFELYKIITQTGWNQLVFITPFFKLKKIEADLSSFTFTEKYDVVYFDAFAPEVQPELWSTAILKKIFNSMNRGGLLVTYCSKSVVQRSLKTAGFEIEKIAGPPGKREILRAFKP